MVKVTSFEPLRPERARGDDTLGQSSIHDAGFRSGETQDVFQHLLESKTLLLKQLQYGYQSLLSASFRLWSVSSLPKKLRPHELHMSAKIEICSLHLGPLVCSARKNVSELQRDCTERYMMVELSPLTSTVMQSQRLLFTGLNAVQLQDLKQKQDDISCQIPAGPDADQYTDRILCFNNDASCLPKSFGDLQLLMTCMGSGWHVVGSRTSYVRHR